MHSSEVLILSAESHESGRGIPKLEINVASSLWIGDWMLGE